MRYILFSMPLLLAAGPVDAPPVDMPPAPTLPTAPAAPAWEPSLKAPVMSALDEHTTLVLVEDHRVPLVQLQVVVPAGSWSPWFIEGHGDEAWTHQNYDPEGQLRVRADALAADISFSVRQQRSVMTVSCLKRDLPEVLTLVRDIFNNVEYDSAELKRTQQGRDISMKSNETDPAFRVRQASHRLLFAEGDPRRIAYEAPLKVQRDSQVLAATRDAMLRLPGRAVGFAGDISPEEAREFAEDLLPAADAAPEGLEPVFLPLNERPPEASEPMDNLTQVYFALLREGPDWDAPDYAAWRVADHVLGGHFFSRLYVALRHEGGETYGATTQGSGAEMPEGYALATFTRTDNRDATEEKLRGVLTRFQAEGITEQELSDAVGYLKGSRLDSRQAPGQVLSGALWELSNERPVGWEDQLNEAAALLTVEQVNQAISAFYQPDRFTLLAVEPAE